MNSDAAFLVVGFLLLTLYRICCRNRGCRASKSLGLDTYIVLNR